MKKQFQNDEIFIQQLQKHFDKMKKEEMEQNIEDLLKQKKILQSVMLGTGTK